MISFVTALLFSFLPRWYWGKWRPHSTVQLEYAALCGGVLEAVAALLQLTNGYLHFMAAVPEAETFDVRLHMGAFLIFTLSYLVKPTSIALIFLLVEGGVRAVAAGVASDVVPTLPLAMIAVLDRSLRASYGARRAEPELPDAVEQSAPGDLRIACSRQKLDWQVGVSVVFEQQIFRLVRYEEGPPPRRFVYHLSRQAESDVIRGLRRYDGEDVGVEL